MNAGDSGCTSGLAKKLYDNWTGDYPANGLGSNEAGLAAGIKSLIKSQLFQFASAIAAEASADVAQYHTATAQTLTNGASTIINFDVADIAHAGVTTGAAWHFTAPVAGNYSVGAAVTVPFPSTFVAGSAYALDIYVNGSWVRRLGVVSESGCAGQTCIGNRTIVALAANDTLDIRAFESSGANRALQPNAQVNWVSIQRI